MGFLRLILAMVVLFAHIGPKNFPDMLIFRLHGFTAVLSFFMISGFYMSLILNRGAYSSLRDFYASRALRLFPPYLIWMGFILTVGSITTRHDPSWASIGSLWDAVVQFTILPDVLAAQLTGNPTNLINGPIFTIGLEIMFYAIAPAVALLRGRTLLVVLVVATVLHLLPLAFGLRGRPWQYEFFPAVLIFFILGHCAYLIYERIEHSAKARTAGAFVFAAMIACAFAPFEGETTWTNSLFALTFYAVMFAAIPLVFACSRDWACDRIAGNLSYPLYVVHYNLIYRGVVDPVESLALVLISALTLYFVLDAPLDKLRHRNFRARSALT